MLAVEKKGFRRTLEFGEAFPDGRLTVPSDGKRYEWKKMIDKYKELGRTLTDEEAEQFRIK